MKVENWTYFHLPNPLFFGDHFVGLLWPFNGVLSQSINDFIPEIYSSQLSSGSVLIMIHLITNALKDWIFDKGPFKYYVIKEVSGWGG